jgi:hypothetical protein
LSAELTEHLGYEPHQEPPGGTGNTRNGTTPKTLVTEHGPVPIKTRGIATAASSHSSCARVSAALRASTTRSSPSTRAGSLRKQLQLLGRRRDASGRTRPPTLSDRDLTEVAMHIQSDRSTHHTPPASTTHEGERRTNDTYGVRVAAHPGKSQGRPVTPAGSQPKRTARPAQPRFSQSPCPATRPTYDPNRTKPAAPPPFSCRYTTLRDVTARPARGLMADRFEQDEVYTINATIIPDRAPRAPPVLAIGQERCQIKPAKRVD